MGQIQTEFGGGNPIGLAEYYRNGAYVTANNTSVPTSGAISLSNFYGAVKEFSFTISSNQANANLRTLAVAAGWDQSAPVVATIGSGVFISSNSTGTPALTVTGSFPSGVQLVNNGVVVGMGGAGGAGAGLSGSGGLSGAAGGSGGLALSVAVAIVINNAGTIAGGGGGGGGGQSVRSFDAGGEFIRAVGGGGGGGGRSSAASNASGGAGGSVIAASNVDVRTNGNTGGAGTVSAQGSGGTAAGSDPTGGVGGGGGGWGASGSSGGSASASNPSGRYYGPGPYAGGLAGGAVTGNSNITWAATGTRLGSIT